MSEVKRAWNIMKRLYLIHVPSLMQPEAYRMITSMMRLVKGIAGQENIPNRLRYNAQIEDDLTGLYYLRAHVITIRVSDGSRRKMWIYNDGLNLYAHCSSNPVMYEDPSGYSANVTESVGEEK